MKRLVCIDLETTGTDVDRDRIWEVCLQEVDGDRSLYFRCNPGVEMTPFVCDLLRVSNDELATLLPFSCYASSVVEFLEGADLMGFNIRSFDVPLLLAELQRCNLSLSLDDVKIFDACVLYKKKYKRSLDSAIRDYLKVEPVGTHNASVDVCYTIDVWKQQLIEHGLEGLDRDALELETINLVDGMLPIDLAGKVARNADGVLCWTFGKNKGQSVLADRGYVQWVLGKDFPAETKRRILVEIERAKDAKPS